MLTREFIKTRLAEVATERGVTVRYANESGSRAWGMASTDSDYDVRFIYQHPKEWYLRLNRPKDMIGPIMELDGELDLVGWDLRKVMSHIAGSNAGVIEWLHSPVVYFEDTSFLRRLRELAATYLQPNKVAAHYLGIARSAKIAGYDETAGDWNLKKYCYYLRPVLAAEFVLTEGKNPPVLLTDLLERMPQVDIRQEVEALISLKESVGESHRMVIPTAIARHFSELKVELDGKLSSYPRITIDQTEADTLFRELIGY